MKTLVLFASSMLLFFFPLIAASQDRPTTCEDVGIRIQADVIKDNLHKQGLKLFQEANIAMENFVPRAIVVRLQQNHYYQFVFVGHQDANKLILELYDGRDKMIDERIVKNASEIIYAYVPEKTDDYLITVSQKKAAKTLCGYFAVMEGSKPPTDSSNHDTGAAFDKSKRLYTLPKAIESPIRRSGNQPRVQNRN